MIRIILSAILLLILPIQVWSETLTIDDLVERNNLYYKKFTDVPFTGELSGIVNGTVKNGKKNGQWLSYWSNGQLRSKGIFKDGIVDGLAERYYENGQLLEKVNFKDGKKDGLESIIMKMVSYKLKEFSKMEKRMVFGNTHTTIRKEIT